jgi:hypothetical protein
LQTTEIKVPHGQSGATRLSPWWQLWREHRTFLLLIALHVLAGVVADWTGYADVIRPNTWRLDLFSHFLRIILGGVVYVFLWHRLKVQREAENHLRLWEGWGTVVSSFRSSSLTIPGLGGAFIVAVGVATSTAIHDGWKGVIGGYDWDHRLVVWDRALHGGMDPWRLLQPLLGVPEVTFALDALYWWWYALLMGGVIWMAWCTDRKLRERLLVAYVLTWVLLGTVTAHLTASVGPCFLRAHLGGPTSFDPLMAYLREVDRIRPLVALQLQDALWAAHRSGHRDYWMSISAMPSLHVAIPALFAIGGWKVSRKVGVALGVYAALTIVASVHLGWHYAVDGYVGAFGAAVAWWIAGRLLGDSQRSQE